MQVSNFRGQGSNLNDELQRKIVRSLLRAMLASAREDWRSSDCEPAPNRGAAMT